MSLLATRIQNWRVANPAFEKNMARPYEFGALDFFIEQTNASNSIVSPDLKARAFQSIGTNVQIPVINYDGEVQVSNVRSCVIGDSENTSALYTIQWTTLSVGFTMIPSLYHNNEISYDHDFSRKMEKVCRAFANALDVRAVATLEANKTQVYTDALYYQVVGNALQIPFVAREDWMGDMDAIMRANAYPSALHIVGNAGIDAMIAKMSQHGAYNDVNKQIQFGGKTFHYTNNVVNEEGKFASFFCVEDGNVGVLTRVDREALARTKASGHEWDVVRLPFIDLEVGSHYYTAVGDQSGVAGAASADMVCNVKEYFGFSVDVAFLVAYNSAPEVVANPIIKGEIEAVGTRSPFATPVEVVNTDANPVYTSEV